MNTGLWNMDSGLSAFAEPRNDGCGSEVERVPNPPVLRQQGGLQARRGCAISGGQPRQQACMEE
jgi:hypothetical protein